ncbi:MAG: glucosaminidase domain-containing protein [Lachnospiraceae bacterium]|nr:glucosaminidase domain-containing protein [Lachnospiraceae bacterium]
MTNAEFIKTMAALAQADMQKNGILASVTIAQAILESGYGTTELAVNANNYFGMKCSLSGNSWSGSTWDGVSKYTKQTQEQDSAGNVSTVTADFRKYSTAAESVGDHSAYLLGAMNGTKKRYAGLQGETDPQTAITIIKNGGYATDTSYVSKVMNVINKHNLTQYDSISGGGTLNINQNNNFGTHNTSVRSGDIEYIGIHYVGATGGAEANVNYYNQITTTGASADFFVGFSGEIWQYNPDPKARYCWAVGGSKQSTKGGSLYGVAKNANMVHIELCVRTKGSKTANSADWYFEDATITAAIELTKYLMNLYGIDADHVIRHYDVNGKLCPGVVGWNADSGDESAWESFKKNIGGTVSASAGTASTDDYYRVRKTWSDSKTQKGAFKDLAKAKKCADQNSGYYVFDPSGNAIYPEESSVPYTVKVEISNLNIRKGPGKSYAKIGKYTGKGTFTIVEESNGWGLLKAYQTNRDGWISLDYTTKVS